MSTRRIRIDLDFLPIVVLTVELSEFFLGCKAPDCLEAWCLPGGSQAQGWLQFWELCSSPVQVYKDL